MSQAKKPLPSWVLAAGGLLLLNVGLGLGWAMARHAAARDAQRAGGGASQPRPSAPAPAAAKPGASGKAESLAATLEPLPPADSPAFATRVREVFADPYENRRLARLQLLLEQCSTAQFAAMVPLIRENDLRGTGSGDEWELVMQNWAKKDGVDVFKFIAGYDWTGWHPLSAPGAKFEALIGWATSDPAAARAYFEDPANAMQHDPNLERALLSGWVAHDAAAAAQWVLGRQEGLMDSRSYQLIVDAVCRKGGQELLDQWFAGLPQDSPQIDRLAEAVTAAKNRFEPEKAAQWLESQQGQPWVADGSLVTSTAAQLASRDPAAALAWAGRTGSAHATDVAMQVWAQRDSTAASQWLRQHPDTPNYDAAAAALATAVSAEDPDAARAWAASLKDPAQREALLQRLAPQPTN